MAWALGFVESSQVIPGTPAIQFIAFKASDIVEQRNAMLTVAFPLPSHRIWEHKKIVILCY